MNAIRPWFIPTPLQRRHLSAAQRDWLLDEGSLTKRLILLSKNHFGVEVISNGWGMPARHEANALGVCASHAVFIREVMLTCHGVPYVFARSLIPAACLIGDMAIIRRFGNKSLGHFLFNSPLVTREPFQLCQFSGTDKVLPASLQSDDSLWGRRSVFNVGDKSLLVSELFLSPLNL